MVEIGGEPASRERMSFKKGDLVVYPNHGAGIIVDLEEKIVLDDVRKYYVVYISDAGLTLSIPADGDTGLRACANDEGVMEMLSTLRNGITEMPSNWNHRLKYNKDKIKSGEILQVAEVVRNLSIYSAGHGLSTGERNMLMKARQILASEVAVVRGLQPREAEKLIDRALQDGKERSDLR